MTPDTESQASPPSRLPSPARFLQGIICALAFCFGMQALYFHQIGGASKGESNYFSTMSRFQAGAALPAEIALVGSSITGRIPGREAGNQEIANLGSDGGPALDGIRLILMGQIDLPKWLVIEANTLYGGVGQGDTLIVKGAQGSWFDVGARLPLLGASARPSSMIYSSLLRRPVIAKGEPFPVTIDEIKASAAASTFAFTPAEQQRWDAYGKVFEILQQRGCKMIMVNYPAGKMKEREEWLMRASIAALAQRVPMTFIDLQKQIPREAVEFTDSVHLAPQSAANVLATLKAAIQTIEAP
jgi:hypothetical protein